MFKYDSFEDFQTAYQNDSRLKRYIAKRFLVGLPFSTIAYELNLAQNTFDLLFALNPEFEEEFETFVETESNRQESLVKKQGLSISISKLTTIVETAEDNKDIIAACRALISVSTSKRGGGDDNDDLDGFLNSLVKSKDGTKS